MDAPTARSSAAPARRRFMAAAALAFLALLGCAEIFLRIFPPGDLHPYLGDDTPLVGIYAPDRDLGVTYRSFAAFAGDNAKRLKPWLPLDRDHKRPVWAMFGNSFVHMHGQLADTTRATVPTYKVFNLGRNEILPLRVAQVRLLLERGFRPDRIFFGLMPVDLYGLAEQPLGTYHVTAQGALTFRPADPPGPLAWLTRHSRLGLTAWCRTGLQRGNPFHRRSDLVTRVAEPMRSDVRRLLGALAEAGHAHGVPVTVLLIPAYQHVLRGERCGFQDDLAPDLRALGLDVFDPRDDFCRHADRPSLFIPDKHFSDEGNRLLLASLLAHLDRAVFQEVSAP